MAKTKITEEMKAQRKEAAKLKRLETKLKHRKENIKNFCVDKPLTLETDLADVPAKRLMSMDTKKQLFRTVYQRGWAQAVAFIIQYINDIVHGIDLMIPIAFFILCPKDQPKISASRYFNSPKKYIDLGYKMYIADGSQRLRTLMGFIQGIIPLPILFDENWEGILDRNTKKTLKKETNVYFEELPKEIQEKVKNFRVKYYCHCGTTMKEYQLFFESMNKYQKKLADIEIYNNTYGDSVLFQKALEYLADPDIRTIFQLNDEKSYNMRDVCDESYMKKSDGGAALMGVFKAMMHTSSPKAQGATIPMIEKFLLENKDKNLEDGDINEIVNKFDYVLRICKEIEGKIYGDGQRSENRIRSVFAAVSAIETVLPGIFERNMEEINKAVEAVANFIPSSQDASGTKLKVNAEIEMYIALFCYICGEFDTKKLFNIDIEAALSMSLKNDRSCNLYEALEDYYYNKSKQPA